jgi:hypothetical protein
MHSAANLGCSRIGSWRLARPVMLTLIQTAKLNQVDPQGWLDDVLPDRRL